MTIRPRLMCRVWSFLAILSGIGPIRGAAEEPRRYVIPTECIHAEQGNCFIASMDFGEEGDKFTNNRSMLMLFEEGKPLGPPRGAHAGIREKGDGRYSHWTRSTLYFSTSDNTDPRTNGRRYQVASANPKSTLGGLRRFPFSLKNHTEIVTSSRHAYTIDVEGTLDMDNTRTLTTSNCFVGFQNNLSLTLENVGETPVVHPRLVINDRGNWYTLDSLLEEFTRGATNEQEKAYFIWQNMRENLYHESPLYGDAEPHDPVRLFNVFGFNLCDDAGNSGCSLFYHAGLTGSKNRALAGHVQCEAAVDGKLQFLDVDMDCFYLDRENERPVSGDECARDHDLVRRELNYGPLVDRFVSSDRPAALFGSDDRLHDARLRGHAMNTTLRPGEKVIFRWDDLGKLCAENLQRAHRPKYFGNSKFVYTPRLTLDAVQSEAAALKDLVAVPASAGGAKLAGGSDQAHLDYEIRTPYPICDGMVTAKFVRLRPSDKVTLACSLDGEKWTPVSDGPEANQSEVQASLKDVLDVLHRPAKYNYFVRVGLASSDERQGAMLCSLSIHTDVLAAPTSLPRLRCGTNSVRYWDESQGAHRLQITHEWKESHAVTPLAPVRAPESPQRDARIRDSLVTFRWPKVPEADRYHLQVSRRPDFRYPYRPSLDVMVPATTWRVPFTGIFSPDTTYYWRLRCRDEWGVWGPWSEGWKFTWQGPRVPVHLRCDHQGNTLRLRWDPNPHGERPVRYEVYGSDEKGFSIHKKEHEVPGRGNVSANFLGETTETAMVVVSPAAKHVNANRVFYRVVAIDARGTASGCSDFLQLPHPFIYTDPVTIAKIGSPYRYQARTLESLGDYQCRQDPAVNRKQYTYRFWDSDTCHYRLEAAPAWLSIDAATGLLTGTPGPTHAKTARIRIVVTNQLGSKDEQVFEVKVEPYNTGISGTRSSVRSPASPGKAPFAFVVICREKVATMFRHLPFRRDVLQCNT
ncbi:MAG: putative Ig domain-containing protein [Pirellulaceae bacterium]